MNTEPDAGGHFGVYGGRYVPEVLMSPMEELEIAYREAQQDPAFHAELDSLLHTYAGRPTPLYFAERLTKEAAGDRQERQRPGGPRPSHAGRRPCGPAGLSTRGGED